MIKTHKTALDPNRDQIVWFYQQCGYAKFAYNSALADFKVDTKLSMYDLNKRFNQKKKAIDWTKSQDQRAAMYAVHNLGRAIDNWRSRRAGFPKFKKRGCKHSYTTDEQVVRVEGKRIKLPKIGWIKTFEALRFRGKIVSVTISRTAHRWFASISVEVQDPLYECQASSAYVDYFISDTQVKYTQIINVENTEAVEVSTHPTTGVDVGINTLATLDNGRKYENPKALKRYERKLKREQRQLSRKKFLSQNWYKQKRKVERLHYRIACIRKDAHHKATTEIVNRAGAIAMETLQVTNLLKNRKLAKALSDAALGGFLQKLKSKAERIGMPITEAPQFFASSKMCSACGHKKDDLTLSDRQYQCSNCGISIERDVNAAINLKHVAVGYTET